MKAFAAAALLCALACACQSTSFQSPPLAADPGCDAALVGRWVSVNDQDRPNDEMKLSVGAQCQLSVTDWDKGKPREGAATTLKVARANGMRYAWMTAGWADVRFANAEVLGTDPADVYLFRYHVEGDTLEVESVDHKAVAHHIIDGAIPGTVRSDDRALVNRITGPADPQLLAMPDLFGAGGMRFRRETGTP